MEVGEERGGAMGVRPGVGVFTSAPGVLVHVNVICAPLPGESRGDMRGGGGVFVNAMGGATLTGDKMAFGLGK